MLLRLDSALFSTLSESWQDWFKDFVKRILRLDINAITEVEYSPECGAMWVWYLRLHPETGKPYVDPLNQDEPAYDVLLYFFDGKPVRVILWDWERAMIAYQGDQGA